MKYTEILQRNKALSETLEGDKFKIAIISNVTVSQLKDVLEFTLREKGINAEVEVADFDAIVQESLRFSQFSSVIIFWEVINLIDGLQSKIYLMSEDEIAKLISKVEAEIKIVLNNLKGVPLVLVNKFSPLVFDQSPLRPGPLQYLADHLNAVLKSSISANQLVVDIESIFALMGFENTRDLRQFYSAKSLYRVGFFMKYSEIIRPAFLSVNGKSKKVLVLDCDNTLWGGILGEDGESGIQMNDLTFKGKIFKEVQNLLLGIQRRGVLLALCSKNNAQDVDKVLESHADILVSNEVFVSKKVNWNDKVSNLIEIASELNLGLDSFVFVDDSSFEIGLIRKELPEVEVVQVPANISDYPMIIKGLEPLFFSLSTTEEDKNKTAMYLQEQQRKNQEKGFESIDQYLESLGLSLQIIWNDAISVSRAAQITQKTNQFNLTTKRYTESDIERMLSDRDSEIAMFSVSDSYGDYGITGMAIVNYNDDQAEIDTLLMSCRVIGRNIELAFFDGLVAHLSKKVNIKTLTGKYIRTAKNKQVESFYEKIGFTTISTDENRSDFSIKLDQYKMNNLNYIKVN